MDSPDIGEEAYYESLTILWNGHMLTEPVVPIFEHYFNDRILPIHIAAIHGCLEVVKFCGHGHTDNFSSPNPEDSSTALHYAAHTFNFVRKVP